MRPLELKMRAFGPYAGEQVLDFRALESRACFLIHGPTGAGKTSILDAMCYALYGESSGGERDPRRMRSDHASPDTPTEVVFDFGLGAEVYRVSRSPEQDRPKSRGEGTTTQPAKAILWRRTRVAGGAGEGEVLASQPRQVNATVETLLGFRRDQFTQVVLLPQGKFRDLLEADSKRREEILEILFQTEAYRRLEEILKKRAAEARGDLDRIEQERGFLLTEAGVEDADGLKERRREQQVVLEGIRADLKKGTRIGTFDTTTDQHAEPGKILLDSIRRFKGLERPVVVLTGIDQLPPDEENALLYVGLSRARVQLVVVATRETMSRLGIR